jgi:hypothetical protein
MEIRNNLSLEDIIYIDDNGIQRVEKWKDIPDWEGFYKASDLGRIKSLSRIILNKGKYPYLSKERILKQQIDKHGYLVLFLQKNKKKKNYKTHQLVGMAFLNHKPNKFNMVINHKDFNRKNNNLTNIEIVTPRDNGNKKHLKSSSEYVGVRKNRCNKYLSEIAVNGNNVYLGTFNTEEEASKYYQNALKAIENSEQITVKRKVFSSKYKGVFFYKRINKFGASIIENGKTKIIGSFMTEQQAFEAREEYIKNLNNKYL